MIELSLRTVRQSARGLARSPGYALTAVTVLALGIGASTGIFSLARALLVQSLPYPDGDRLVQIYEDNPSQGMTEVMTSYPNFRDWTSADSFEAMAVAYNPLNVVIGSGDAAATVTASLVTPPYFELTGAAPLQGRLFDGGDDERPGGHPVVVISAELWAGRFGTDPATVGSALTVNGAPYTIVGVMPEGFADFPNPTQQTDVWLPLMMGPGFLQPGLLEQRINRSLPVLARLREGVTLDAARSEMSALAENLAAVYPDTNGDWTISMRTVRDAYLGDFRVPVLALLAGSAFLLLVGCANIASLQVARARARRGELALRAALGASRRRLWGDAVVESVLLTLAGGAFGVLCAAWLTPLVVRLMPVDLPRFVAVQVDTVALAAAVSVSVVVGFVFGFVPLAGQRDADLRREFAGMGSGGGAGGEGRTLRRALVVVEVAAAALLMLGAGLFVRSTTALLATDVGFGTENLLTLRVQQPVEGRTPLEMSVLAAELTDAAAALPGVRAATYWAPHVPGAAFWYTRVQQEDRPELRDDELTLVRFHYAGPGALRALGLRFVSGRGFEPGDDAAGRHVVVVSQTLAEALWPGDNPLGRRLKRWNREPWHEVVGVVEDAYLSGRLGGGSDFARDVFFPYLQEPQNVVTLLVRSDGSTTAAALRETVQQGAPDLPVYDVRTMRDILGDEEATPRVTAAVAATTAALALLLAAIGLYSVVAYGVSQRRREIGLHIALGAWPGAVLRRVVGQGLALASVGLVVGVGAALVLTRWLTSVLYEVSPLDPLTYIVVPVVVLAIVAGACLIPALRATRIHPMVALRTD